MGNPDSDKVTGSPTSIRRLLLRILSPFLEAKYAFSFNLLIWSLSFLFISAACAIALGTRRPSLPDVGTLAALLFGAASIALFLFSFLAAILAIFGWQAIKDHIREKVDSDMEVRIKELENKLEGRIASGL